MIYPDTPINEWREQHGLPVKSDTCSKCNKVFELNVPIVMQGCVGVSTPMHECGENFHTVLLTPWTEKAKEFWGKVV